MSNNQSRPCRYIGRNSFHVAGFDFGWFGTMQSACAALDINHPYGTQYNSRNCTSGVTFVRCSRS
jgi:hypothetical protein